MRFTIAACVAILAAIAEARVHFTNTQYDVSVDKPFELTWAEAAGPVTITLRNGPQANLRTVSTLASVISGSSTTVTLKSSDFESGLYVFAISDGPDFENFSPQFNLAGTGAGPSTASPVSTTAATATTAASTTTPAATTPATTATDAKTTEAHSTVAKPTTATNGTASAPTTLKTTAGSAASTAANSTSAPPSTGSGAQLQSSLALIFLGAAAFVFLN